MHYQTVGSRAQVYHGTALHTSGYLYKGDLLKNKRGRIVPKSRHYNGKKMYQKNKKYLQEYQYY